MEITWHAKLFHLGKFGSCNRQPIEIRGSKNTYSLRRTLIRRTRFEMTVNLAVNADYICILFKFSIWIFDEFEMMCYALVN